MRGEGELWLQLPEGRERIGAFLDWGQLWASFSLISAVCMRLGLCIDFLLWKWHRDCSWVSVLDSLHIWVIKFTSKFSECRFIGGCFRDVVGLLEDLHRVMNTTKSASLFCFMIDSAAVDWSFCLAGVPGFQCPWKLTRTLLCSDSKIMATVFPGGPLEMAVGFTDRYRHSGGNKCFLRGVNALALCSSLWILIFFVIH